MKITMAHGSGGKETSELIKTIFTKHIGNEILSRQEDSAILQMNGKIAYTTDSFVVTPLVFKGGDIGKLAICGTVNDLLMAGAHPQYISAGFIIEEGMDFELLETIVISMAESAREAGVKIVAADTKVINGNGGIYINTSGIGFIPDDRILSVENCKVGDCVILSGDLGDHHACIYSSRMGIQNDISSDAMPLCKLVDALFDNDIKVNCMRDVTRGGLATILNELSEGSKCAIDIDENSIPVGDATAGLCSILGLDPLFMGNEGKFVAIVSPEHALKALEILHSTPGGENAAIIGKISEGKGVKLTTKIGGKRLLNVLYGEGLPRIC